MAIVMGLDQHRAQITAEWLDIDSGELSRRRICPADRVGVRHFAARFGGEELDVALEATTGWRFVADEFRAIGARVHLAEPAETATLRGTRKRAKTDRADARHLRELLMLGRLPQSWIPAEHLLELRARVRLRHTLVDQRREWQQRMQGSAKSRCDLGRIGNPSRARSASAPPATACATSLRRPGLAASGRVWGRIPEVAVESLGELGPGG